MKKQPTIGTKGKVRSATIEKGSNPNYKQDFVNSPDFTAKAATTLSFNSSLKIESAQAEAFANDHHTSKLFGTLDTYFCLHTTSDAVNHLTSMIHDFIESEDFSKWDKLYASERVFAIFELIRLLTATQDLFTRIEKKHPAIIKIYCKD